MKDLQLNEQILGEYFDLSNTHTSDSLRVFLSRNEVGSTVDYRTPFWDKAPREEILQHWQVIFDRWYESGADIKVFESLYQFEMDMKSKVGPLSIMQPLSERMEGIREYWTSVTKFRDKSDLRNQFPYAEGHIRTTNEFTKLRGIRLRSARRVVDQMKLSTNSGSPYFTKRKRVVSKTLEGKANQFKRTAVLGWRGQEGGPSAEDVKQRAIFMMPFELNIEELQLYQPFIEAVQKLKLIPPYVSTKEVEQTMTRLFDSKEPNQLVIATDFTKFDQHFNKICQDMAFDFWAYLLLPGYDNRVSYGKHTYDNTNWLIKVYEQKFHIPLLVSNDVMITGHHGMGSGSGGTNADETIVHRILQHATAAKCHKELNPNSMCLGDDGIISFPDITVEDVLEVYTGIGLEMNTDKQYVSSTNTIFLRRWYHTQYRSDGIMKGVYSTFRALGRLMGQERYYDPRLWNPKMVVLRALSIIENTSNHPLFEQFVDFVLKGDKYKLGLDIPGFFDNINATYAEAKAKLPSFGSYTQDLDTSKGISQWRVVQYLKTKK